MNKLRKQIGRVLETDEYEMKWIWREMLKTVLAEGDAVVRKGLSNIITAV